MKTKVAFGLVLTFLLLAIYGCGGGGGGGSGSATPPVLMTVAQSATTANTNNNTINTSVAITAHATVNGVAVPDGTPVDFTVKSGAGILSAPSAATVNGTASVILTSTTDGTSVVVSASNGGTSADSAAITFTDANRVTDISITANSTAGIVPGTPVAISASVFRLGGNGVAPGSVADGTIVSFAVSSGTGTLSAASAPTTGGIATVNLSSTVTNASVNVTAAVGVISNFISVPFITQPTQAIVKVQTSGPLPANGSIAILNADITYAPNKGLSITNVAFTGAAAGATGFNTPNVSTSGQVVITTDTVTTISVGGLTEPALLNNRAGIPAGEFATLTFSIAPGFVPTVSDFGIASFIVADDGATPIPGMSVTIMSVTIQ